MGGWWRLDEVIELSLQLVCSRAHEVVPVAPTPIEVEAYDSDHEVSDQVTVVPRRVTRMHTTSEWYSNLVLKVMLLDNNEPTSYGEAMVGPKFRQMVRSHEIRDRIHVSEQSMNLGGLAR